MRGTHTPACFKVYSKAYIATNESLPPRLVDASDSFRGIFLMDRKQGPKWGGVQRPCAPEFSL